MPPLLSLTAMIFIPASAISRAAVEPTLPNPCTATVAPSARIFFFASAQRVTTRQPRPVASLRPSEPPIATGLPVTTPVTVCRLCIE